MKSISPAIDRGVGLPEGLERVGDKIKNFQKLYTCMSAANDDEID